MPFVYETNEKNEHIRHTNLAEALNRCAEKALHDSVRNPLPVGFRVRRPDLNRHRSQDTNQINGSFPILQRQWLPNETSPSKGQEHVAVTE